MTLKAPPVQVAVDTNGTKLSVPWQQWFWQLYQQLASPSMQSVYFGDSTDLDAFGRLRVSTPTTLFASTQYYTSDTLHVENYVAGTATATYTQATASTTLSTVAATSGNRALRQTKVYWRYQPGKSQLVLITGTLAKSGIPVGGAYAGIGYYDDANGVYFRRDVNGYSLVIRTSTSGSVVETIIPQSQWNDPMNGTGVSGITIDFTKEQIFIIDLQWLGVGRVRFSLNVNGTIVPVHAVNHANLTTAVYMQSANLPVRFEVNNVTAGSAISVECICISIQSEGGVSNEGGYSFECDNANSPKSVANTATLTPVMSLRCQDTWQGVTFRGHLSPITINMLAQTNPVYWEWVWNGTLTGATFAPVSASNSGAEFDTAATAISGGISLSSGFVLASGSGSNVVGVASHNAPERLILARTYANVRDVLTLCARGLGGAATLYATINYEEQH